MTRCLAGIVDFGQVFRMPKEDQKRAESGGGPPTKASDNGPVSPMMVQYHEIKRSCGDAILFYRTGDFYEMFFEDAERAAASLDIVLTKRGRHNGADIPMCGVPVHAAETYLSRLIRSGYRVAVCEQTEDPATARKRGYKSVVNREIARIVTPGTLVEDSFLDTRRNNFLAAVADAGLDLGLAWLDISTGLFLVEKVDLSTLATALARIEPGELLVPERLASLGDGSLGDYDSITTRLTDSRFDSEAARRRIEELFAIRALDAFGDFSRAELSACGALLGYIDHTQRGHLPLLQPPRRMVHGAAMEIDPATRRNLELVQTLSGERRGSLLATIDRTISSPGARLLASRLAAPLTDAVSIAVRHESVEWLLNRIRLRDAVRDGLRKAPDIERALSRLTVDRGGPRDLAAVRDGLEVAAELRARLNEEKERPPWEIADAVEDLGSQDTLSEHLGKALADDLPLLVRDGNFIRTGYSAELDELRVLRDESRKLIASLEARYCGETGITSLKIRHNNVLGFFIDVTAVQAEKMPTGSDSPFIHRQTLARGTRYTTVELTELEGKLAQAAERALALELQLFDELVEVVAGRSEALSRMAAAIAVLDVSAALSALAAECNYVRPTVDMSRTFRVQGGRHPVVEAVATGTFVANDVDLAPDRRLWLVTGPNMAGKSTFLRQNALIAILAQAGSFVPAMEAHIGVVDRLFSRVGAADDLARGRSTFMVEMVETATILNQASDRSLVILDEIGRGTATFDGLSIAWATLEHLHEVNRCRALFATHFHELTSLTSRLEALSCHTVRVREWEGDVIFLHEVVAGTADKSYGVHVAKLAGMPEAVVSRAREILSGLEQDERSGAVAHLADDLPLFLAAAAEPEPRPVEIALAELNPDELSPREALELLYRFKTML